MRSPFTVDRVLLTISVVAFGTWAALQLFPGRPVKNRTVLITEFDNRTGQPIFDDVVAAAFRIAFDQTPEFVVRSPGYISEAMVLAGHSSPSPLTLKIATTLCASIDNPVLLSGALERAGEGYTLAARVQACDGGATLARAAATAASPDGVISAVTDVSRSLRKTLGESPSSLRAFDRAIEEATTYSIETLKLFALAERAHEAGSLTEAEGLYVRAIQRDSSFALGLSRFAEFLAAFRPDEAARAVALARPQQQRLTRKEQFRLDAVAASSVDGDLDAAHRVFADWHATLPRDAAPVRELGRIAMLLGDYHAVVRYESEAQQLEPRREFPARLVAATAALGDFARARALYEKALMAFPDLMPARVGLFNVAMAQGDRMTMEAIAKWAVGRPDAAVIENLQASVAGSHGMFDRRVPVMPIGIACVLAGLSTCARATLAAGVGTAPPQIVPILVINAFLGERAAVDASAESIRHEHPRDTLMVNLWLPAAEAALRLRAGQPDEAIRVLEPTRRFDLSPAAQYVTLYLRADALRQAGNASAAAQEFRKLLSNSGVTPTSPLLSLAHLGLARASRMAGRQADSEQEYRVFLELWNDATPADIPLLEEAKRELRGLS